MPLPCAVRVVAVRHCPALGARGGAFCMSMGVPMCGWLAKGRDLVEGFGLYQNLLNLVDLEEIAIPVYANL